MTPLHERLAHLALAAAARFDFALAGCHALRAHGLGERPGPDIELLTPRVDGVTEGLPAISGGLAAAGFEVVVELAGGSFARLRVRAPEEPPPARRPAVVPAPDQPAADGPGEPAAAGASTRIKLCVEQRVYPPARLPVGPVLSADDAVVGAMFALLGRHLAEDFLDVDLVLGSGHYTKDDLLRLALRHDRDFQAAFFCESLAALRFISDAAFAPYGLTGAETGALRARFAQWQRELIATWLSSG